STVSRFAPRTSHGKSRGCVFEPSQGEIDSLVAVEDDRGGLLLGHHCLAQPIQRRGESFEAYALTAWPFSGSLCARILERSCPNGRNSALKPALCICMTIKSPATRL